MSITGRPDGEPGAGPLRVGVAFIDLFTGVYASTAILAALRTRDRAGQGQHIDMSLLDVGMAVLANQASAFLNGGIVPGRFGNAHPSLVPYQDMPTCDGAVLLAVGNDGQFARFCEAAGCAWLATDKRFTTNTRRVRNREPLISLLESVTRSKSTAEWIGLLEDKAVPCGPINDIAQGFDDPQVLARGLKISQTRDAGDGIERVAGVASPLRLQATPPVRRFAPPTLGQHTDEILQDLGFSRTELDRMRAGGIV